MSDETELARRIRSMWNKCDDELRRDHQRSLPLGDALFDRWERAKKLGFAEGASIYHSALVFGAVSVGRNTWVGPNVMLDGSGGGVKIGQCCSLSAGVHIYTHDTALWAVSGGAKAFRKAPVEIGDCCYVGSQAIIAAGVKIGSRCIVGSNSFVNDDVPDGMIVAGSTAKPIGRVIGAGEHVRLEFFPGVRS